MTNVLTPVKAGYATDNRAKEESKHSSPLSENDSNCGAIASRFANITRRYFTKSGRSLVVPPVHDDGPTLVCEPFCRDGRVYEECRQDRVL
jgi:hypothetical protein